MSVISLLKSISPTLGRL